MPTCPAKTAFRQAGRVLSAASLVLAVALWAAMVYAAPPPPPDPTLGVSPVPATAPDLRAAHSALWAGFGHLHPCFRGRLVVRLMYRCRV